MEPIVDGPKCYSLPNICTARRKKKIKKRGITNRLSAENVISSIQLSWEFCCAESESTRSPSKGFQLSPKPHRLAAEAEQNTTTSAVSPPSLPARPLLRQLPPPQRRSYPGRAERGDRIGCFRPSHAIATRLRSCALRDRPVLVWFLLLLSVQDRLVATVGPPAA